MSIDLLRATLPKRGTYDKKCWDLARHFMPNGTDTQLDTLAIALQWTAESEIDTMKFEEESHG
jgi:hypothetical protein